MPTRRKALTKSQREYADAIHAIISQEGSEQKKAGTPRVSNVLKPIVDFSGIPAATLKNAANRGTRIHGYIEDGISRNDYKFSGVPDDERFYTDSFNEFWPHYRLLHPTHGHFVEVPVGNRILNLRGTADLISIAEGEHGARIQICDWKTSRSLYPSALIQMALYAMCIRKTLETQGIPIEDIRASVVRLQRDGTVPEVGVLADCHYATAEALIEVHRFRAENDEDYRRGLEREHAMELGGDSSTEDKPWAESFGIENDDGTTTWGLCSPTLIAPGTQVEVQLRSGKTLHRTVGAKHSEFKRRGSVWYAYWEKK